MDIFVRGTPGVRAQIFSDFDGGGAQTPTAGVSLDAFGGATVYVNQPVECVAYATDGTAIRPFVEMETATAVEVISQSFTGRNYDTGAAAAGQPLLLSAALDLWKASAGTTDFNVLVGGVVKTLQSVAAAAAALGYFNVKDPAYGAIGDGVVNDRSAFNAAIAAANAAGGVLYIPKGTYNITGGALTAINGAAGILGYGATLTSGSSGFSAISITAALNNAFFIIGLACSFSGTSVNCITVSGAVSAFLQDVTISAPGLVCIGIVHPSTGTSYLLACTVTAASGSTTQTAGTLIALASAVNPGMSCSGATAMTLGALGCKFSGAAGGAAYVSDGAATSLILVGNAFANPAVGNAFAYSHAGAMQSTALVDVGNALGSNVSVSLVGAIGADATGSIFFLQGRLGSRLYNLDGVSPVSGDCLSAVNHFRRTAAGAVTLQFGNIGATMYAKTWLVLENDSGSSIVFGLNGFGNIVGAIASVTVGANRVQLVELTGLVVAGVPYGVVSFASGDIAGI